MEIGTGLAILASAPAAKELLVKLLGPSAEYFGEGLKTWTEKRVENVNKIFGIAIGRLGERIKQPGGIPPKIIRGIVNEGSFCEDQLTAEYFGGILAGSRSDISRDDRGITFISLLSSLSTYQIRAHYIFYQIMKMVLNGETLNFKLGEDRKKAHIYIPWQIFVNALAVTDEERTQLGGISAHIMFGLEKEQLISPLYALGTTDNLRKIFATAPGEGIVIGPSPLGVELFLWGHGRSELDIGDFLNIKYSFDVSQEVSIGSGSMRT